MQKTLAPFRYKKTIFIVLVLNVFNALIAQQLVYDTLHIRVLPVKSINTKNSEYAPYRFKNQFYFVSDRESQFFMKGQEQASNESFSNLYKGEIKDSLTIRSVELAKQEAISKIFVGPFCETALGYYYTTNQIDNKNRNKPLKLQISFIEKEISTSSASTYSSANKNKAPVKITFGLNDTISCAHPTVVNDTLMFFASDWQENSQGKIDLFYSIKKNNEWQKPINCGSAINSTFNESFPYYIDGDLYFSSDRNNGFGQLDIYKNKWKDRSSVTSLLPYPINSPFDDFSVSIDSSKQKGYLSSNRNGNDDIFYFTNVIPEINNCVEMKNNNYCFTFYEEAGKETKDTVGQTYEWSIGSTIKKRGLEVKHCFPKQGKYEIKLNVINKSSGETFYNLLTYELNLEDEEQLFIHIPDSTQTGKEILFDPTYSNIKGFKINRYIWDFGDGSFAYEQKPKHKYAKDGDYIVKLSTEGLINGKVVKRCVYKKIVLRSNQIKDVFLYNLPTIEED